MTHPLDLLGQFMDHIISKPVLGGLLFAPSVEALSQNLTEIKNNPSLVVNFNYLGIILGMISAIERLLHCSGVSYWLNPYSK